eukprot:5971236-Alexandrium_andersonii.AAC.1
MSASLVGSEMCIRDRSYVGLRRRGGSSGRGVLAGGVPPGESVASSPVSYTHLTLPTICSV